MRMPPKRYWGTAFNRAQIVKLQEMLGLERKKHAVMIAAHITAALYSCKNDYDARCQMPDLKDTKRRLGRISSMAADLAELLEDEVASEQLLREPGSFLTRQNPDDVIDIAALRQEDIRRFNDLLAGLKMISQNADRYSTDEHAFRSAYRADAKKFPYIIHLWPKLFEIWELSGHQISGTPEGPLHRFVSFVHKTCGLTEVKASTLRDAGDDWKHDSLRATIAEGPPWWTWGED